MGRYRTGRIDDIAATLRDLIPPGVADALRFDDAAEAIRGYYPPVRLRRLSRDGFPANECSVDGFYEVQMDPSRPWIFYADDVASPRRRFTLLHELGHHLIATEAAAVLDDIDRLSSDRYPAAQIEETVCHRLAGQILLPPEEVDEVIGDGPVVPDHLRQLHGMSTASWEAVAVRAAERIRGHGAVVLIRRPGTVHFCAGSRNTPNPWWPRGSQLDPNGPLARAHRANISSKPDTYRYGLAYAHCLYADSLCVADGLAVAVMQEQATDGQWRRLRDPDPLWKTKEENCRWCDGERDEGWCDACRGRRCNACQRCGCTEPIAQSACPGCHLQRPKAPGHTLCVDCEDT